jgi:putative transposase
VAPGGVIYHVLNRGVGRQNLFDDPDDFAAFARVVHDVLQAEPIRILGYCLMPNHWHLILWPGHDGQLARFMQRLTITHVRRWVEYRHRVGWGSIYQGRYKSFPVQEDRHLLTLLRYVERNPLRANLVSNAQNWRWSSLGQRECAPDPHAPTISLSPLPLSRPRDWIDWVNRPQTDQEERALQRSLRHDRPYGSPLWSAQMEAKLNLPPLRPRGRPKKATKPKTKPKRTR